MVYTNKEILFDRRYDEIFIHLFEVHVNGHLVNYFSLLHRCRININLLHLTFHRAKL